MGLKKTKYGYGICPGCHRDVPDLPYYEHKGKAWHSVCYLRYRPDQK